MIANTLGWIGRITIRTLIHLSNIAYLTRDILHTICIGPWKGRPLRRRAIIREMDELGVRSLPLISMMSLFLGSVFVMLMAPQFTAIGAPEIVPTVVTVLLVREFNPLVTGIVLAGRVGAMVTARLGTMVSDDEILALEVMAINPIEYIIAPLFIATLVMLPCLTILADLIGMTMSLIIATTSLGLHFQGYLDGMLSACSPADIGFSLVKSLASGVVIILIACYQGINVQGGAEGIGRSTMFSVVVCTIAVIGLHAVLSIMYMMI